MRSILTALVSPMLVSLIAVPGLAWSAEDPPGRVARLSHIEGEVSMAPAGTQEWGEAVLNRPLTSEDRLYVDRAGRAELQVGSATIHLDGATEFSFIDLDDDAMAMNLTEGRATIRILRKREREDIEVSTPNASVALLHPGEYHIEVDEEGETTIVKARSGEAEVAGEADVFTVRANEVGVFRGAEKLTADVSRIAPRTTFEAWANERAQRNERSASSKYVGEGVIGYEDLDEHGHWVQEPEYGYVWRPTYVVAGWAPYRYGRWAWISPWGWTWIDDARWGFAPFHYGRWAYVRHRWCWVPGPRHVRAIYAPALVAWVGGPHVSVNISLGHGVGWFPLGPREIYVPGYWHTRRYIHRVNVSNTIIVNNTYIDRAYRGRYRDFDYRHRGRPDAVTIVEREHFVRGRPVGQHVARIDDRALRRLEHDARPPAIAPSRESVLAGPTRAIRRPTESSRQVVSRRVASTRVSFDQERQAIEANGGRPVSRNALVDRSRERAFRVSSDANDRGRRTTGASGRQRSVESREAANAGSVQAPASAAPERSSRDEATRRATPPSRGTQRGDAARDARIQRNNASEPNSSGSPPNLGATRERNSGGRMPPMREDSGPSGERQRLEQPRSAPQRESRTPERSAPTRIEQPQPRTFSQPETRSEPRAETRSAPRSAPRVENAPAPRVERAPEPRVEQSQPRSESRSERSSQPRAERSNAGRVSRHGRGERER